MKPNFRVRLQFLSAILLGSLWIWACDEEKAPPAVDENGDDGNGNGGGDGGDGRHRSCTGSAPSPLKLTEITAGTGLYPVYLTSAPGDASRLFIVDRTGTVSLIQDGNMIEAGSIQVESGGGEQGLHSIAFHPDFGENEKRVYLAYNQPGGDTAIAELTLDGNTLDTSNIEDKIIFEQDQPAGNHNGGQLLFGPDGYLYFGLGDGGGGCDTYEKGDDLSSPLATIIRLDVDNLENYPEGNLLPTAGRDGRILHHGLRNPWRFSFDEATGDLYIGDVGQNAYEEINVLPAGSGNTDFGWPSREGTHSSAESDCAAAGNKLSEHRDPVFDYPRSEGQSVTGGYVYRGKAISGLVGRYLFADWGSEHIWTLTWDGSKMCDLFEISEEIDPEGILQGINSFGQDANGELYITAANGGNYGVYRIDAE